MTVDAECTYMLMGRKRCVFECWACMHANLKALVDVNWGTLHVCLVWLHFSVPSPSLPSPAATGLWSSLFPPVPPSLRCEESPSQSTPLPDDAPDRLQQVLLFFLFGSCPLPRRVTDGRGSIALTLTQPTQHGIDCLCMYVYCICSNYSNNNQDHLHAVQIQPCRWNKNYIL